MIIRRLSVRDRATPARAPNGAYVLSRRPALTTPGMSTAVDHQVALPEVVLPAPRVVPPLEMPRAKTPDLRAPATVATSRIALAEPLAPRPASVSPPPAPRPSPPTEDSALADAIRKLRVDGDAAAALTLLDDQQSSLSASAFRPEASAVRIEALLKLGRTHAALSALDRLPLDSMPRRDEWQVVRGELRATAGRWLEAEADFAAVLTSRSSDARGNLGGRFTASAQRPRHGRIVGLPYRRRHSGVRELRRRIGHCLFEQWR